MTDAANPSGLTDEEAQEFHQYYIQGYLLWRLALSSPTAWCGSGVLGSKRLKQEVY